MLSCTEADLLPDFELVLLPEVSCLLPALVLAALEGPCAEPERAERFLGLAGGTSSPLPSFSSFRKCFCAWLRTCRGWAGVG